MLAVAVVTVAAVLLRWSGLGGIAAMNEIVGILFAVAIAATLPGATAQRIYLCIDLLGVLMGPGLRRWLDLVGALLLLVFLVLLAAEVQAHAARLLAGGRTTPILGWPVGPFMLAVAVLLWATAAVQAVLALLDLSRMARQGAAAAGLTHPLVWLLVAATGGAVVWLAWWGWTDFRGLSQAVTGSPSVSVGLGFALLWMAMLVLMPVSAVMGLMGLVGTALFLNWRAAWSVLSSETAGFLTNPQVAALPLLLLMGSYAPALASGTVAAGGTLGALIPPSAPIILFVLLTEASIGQLFVAAVIPGLLAAALYMLTIAVATC